MFLIFFIMEIYYVFKNFISFKKKEGKCSGKCNLNKKKEKKKTHVLFTYWGVGWWFKFFFLYK